MTGKRRLIVTLLTGEDLNTQSALFVREQRQLQIQRVAVQAEIEAAQQRQAEVNRRERDGDLDQCGGQRPAAMYVHFQLAFFVGFLGECFQFFRRSLDFFLFVFVAGDFLYVFFASVAFGQVDGKLREILLVAFGLIIVPLVRGRRLLDRRLVLVEQGVVLRVAAHVAEQGADGRQDGGQDRQARGEAVATVVGDMLDFVIVRTVNMKAVTGHRGILLGMIFQRG